MMRCLPLSLLAFWAIPAGAHESLPGFLEILERKPGTYQVIWKVPAIEGAPPAIAFEIPPACHTLGETNSPLTPGALTERWLMQCSPTLLGQRIEIAGLERTLLDVLVRIRFASGAVLSQMVRPLDPGFVVTEPETVHIDQWGYLRLGVEHILYGIDHLFFVFGLLLVVKTASRVLQTTTAFTVAHTITLALAVCGVVHVPAPPTEAVIALSIVFLGYELAKRQWGRIGLTYQHPWIVAFAFGLLHGFGFAGTLSRLGLPSGEIPSALLLFNCGVELGQVAFIAAILLFARSLSTLDIRTPRWAEWGVPYAFGSLAMFWFFQRCANLI
jgi:hydrogenase/urease accessory protein HupE